MKTLGFILALTLCSFAAFGQRITASITVTNATTNGMTFTVNGIVRTWTNNVVTSSSQIATNADATGCGSKTNLLLQIRLNPYAQILPFDTGSNTLQLVGNCGQALVVTVSAGYASVAYTTNVCTPSIPVQSPFSVYPSSTSTNVGSQLIQDLNTYATNSISQTSPIAGQLVGTNNNQTISGGKNFNNPASLYSGIISNSPSISGNIGNMTNGNIYGASLIGGSISGLPTIYLSNSASSGTASFFTHYDGGGDDSFMITHGGNEFFLGLVATNGTGILGGQSKSYIDFNLNGEAEYNVEGGFGSSAHRFYLTPNSGTATNYFEITYQGVRAPIATAPFIGNGDGVTNIHSLNSFSAQGTNTFGQNSDIAFSRYALSTLGNGINQDIVVGTNVFIEVSGPGSAFSIEGIAGGRDGKLAIIVNQTGQNMTIATEGGATGNDPTPANRIISMTGADRVTTGNGVATLIYSGAASRWLLIAFDP